MIMTLTISRHLITIKHTRYFHNIVKFPFIKHINNSKHENVKQYPVAYKKIPPKALHQSYQEKSSPPPDDSLFSLHDL